ncbi:MAG: glycosyltransferase family protein [Calditrichia bacterium]
MNILFAILDMGLGHATRSLPVIRRLQKDNHRLFLASSGRALQFLKQEMPDAAFLKLPSYGFQYLSRGVSLLHLGSQVPHFLRAVRAEQRLVEKWIGEYNIRRVISDHRYGCFSREVPAYFISHQLRFAAPRHFYPLEFTGAWFNDQFHRRFSAVLVPDLPFQGGGFICGRLARPFKVGKKYCYCGPLSSINPEEGAKQEIDLFISISGPEPQRTVLEEIIRQQLPALKGNIVMALGKPESVEVKRFSECITIYDHPARRQMQQLLNRSRMVVCRSGFSTLMELAVLGKPALLIPTPGQTEQLYLSRRLAKKGWFLSKDQNNLDLPTALKEAALYTGFPQSLSGHSTVETMAEIITEGFEPE